LTDEFKAGAIRLVLDEGKTIPQVARDLDLTQSALRAWVERARADRGRGKPGVPTTAEKEELARLRKENPSCGWIGRSPQSRGLLREAPIVKFAFIDAEKAHYPITRLCLNLAVSRAGFYAWCGRFGQRLIRLRARLHDLGRLVRRDADSCGEGRLLEPSAA
jgi:transposase-like protein